MQLTAPNLDDRTFQNIVDEAKKRIPAYIDGWTDHNVSDPGVTLIELFAWMTEMLLYRQNQVPDRLYVKMMQLLGMDLQEPQAATTAVTFQLSTPLTEKDKEEIAAATQVATTQTETVPSIIFATDKELTIYPAKLERAIVHRQAEDEAQSNLDVEALRQGQVDTRLFSSSPLTDDAIYFGFADDKDISHHLLHFFFGIIEAYGTAGIDVTRSPLRWEGAGRDETGQVRWQPCELESDETFGLVVSGQMVIHLPQLEPVSIKVDPQKLYWLRLRVLRENEYGDERTRPFTQSPRISQITTATIGGSVQASHAEVVKDEFLGYSDGSPGQQFYLQSVPILAPQADRDEILLVRWPKQETDEKWTWTAAFDKPDDEQKVFTLNRATGEIRLPPALTDRTGAVQLYGAIPPRNATLRFQKYRHGGGVVGNVDAYALDTLKSSIPSVNRVYNRHPARGGQEQETIEAAKLRAPHLLHAQKRAVTAADFEFLATQAGVAVGRVKCLQREPGWVDAVDPGVVYVFVLPSVDKPARHLLAADLNMPQVGLNQIKAHLDQCRLLTTRLRVERPQLAWVSAHVTCRLAPGADKKAIEAEVRRRLYTFLNPLVGGPDKKGWPFGRSLYTYDVYTCLQGIPNLFAVTDIVLYRPSPDGEVALPGGVLELSARAVIVSATHEVIFIR